MAKKYPQPTTAPRERAFLVGVDLFQEKTFLPLEDSLTELALLSDTSGLDVVGELTQKLDRPHVKTYIGPGKVDELKALVEETTSQVVIFDDELSPRHQRELQEALGENVKVLDRTALILDIFAQHAHTSEGMLQVELAQYEYYLPRLTGQWTHLERQAGGGGGRAGSTGGVGLRGPGETQLEVDKRAIRKRIAHLKRELEKVEAHRERYRSQRKRSRIPTVALVGYTNAGKSTLLNRLAKSDVYVANQLFATLDPTTRRVELPGGYQALCTDTVEDTLDQLGAHHIPVVTALNKVDRLRNPEAAKAAVSHFSSKAVTISALTGNGISDLLRVMQEELYETYTPILVKLPYQQGALISLFHEAGQVERIEHGRGGVLMQGRIPGRLVAQFNDWQVSPNHHEPEEQEDEEEL